MCQAMETEAQGQAAGQVLLSGLKWSHVLGELKVICPEQNLPGKCDNNINFPTTFPRE